MIRRFCTAVFAAVLLGLACWPAAAAAKPPGNPATEPFELVPGSFALTPSTTQAAAHEDLIVHFDFAHDSSGRSIGDARTTVVSLPAGFVASDTAVPTCSVAQLLAVAGEDNLLPACPIASQVGQIKLDLSTNREHTAPAEITAPVYNMEVTSFGVTAELAFKVGALITQVLPVSVRPGDLGLTVTAPDITKTGEVRDITFTTWGVPGASSHDAQRGEVCGPNAEIPPKCHNEWGGPQATNIPAKPFLSNPTACGSATASMKAASWEAPEAWTEAVAEVEPIVGCERVPFEPSVEVHPTTLSAESPTGLNVSLLVPQTWENPYSIASANLKDTTVTLPRGMTINPSAGSGLGACTPAQYEEETSEYVPGKGCPPESKIGSIEIETPLLAEKLEGAIYVATPYNNPFSEPGHPNGSLLALYIVARDPQRGILIKVAGQVHLNPVTGQLTTTFLNTPQQPFSKFTLKFRPGATAPLVSPPACGTYTTEAALTPWSAPEEPRLVSYSFETTQGVHEGPCPSGGVPPFKPAVTAGTQNNAAGSYSPFYLRIERKDGEQEITKFSTIMPPGLSGKLAGVPFCPEADIQHAREQTGAQAQSEPACPAASEVGHSITEAGVGTVLAQTPGKLYLAGPYHGAPLSLVSITSAKVGPFDLGTVVIRFALFINPLTAQVEVSGAQSDPIPHIIDGIVVHVRNIRAYVDRENFMLNPTSCDPMAVENTITGAGADPANPADQQSVNVSTHFQAADCASLAFKPTFTASTSAKTSRKEGASLHVSVTYPQGSVGHEANLRETKVELPKALPSELKTLQKACTAKQFAANPAGCPAESVVGHAIVHTPVLPVPLEGPAYFVSEGAEWPELIIVLQGYGLTIDLVGETHIKKGVTSSTFQSTPDVPFESFELSFPESTHSALAANGNLCDKKLIMPTYLTGQNGAQLKQPTRIAVEGCPNKLSVIGKRLKGHTLTLKVAVPAAGKLTASADGLSSASKAANGREPLTLTLHIGAKALQRARHHAHGKKHAKNTKTTIKLSFKPTKGKKLKKKVKARI